MNFKQYSQCKCLGLVQRPTSLQHLSDYMSIWYMECVYYLENLKNDGKVKNKITNYGTYFN